MLTWQQEMKQQVVTVNRETGETMPFPQGAKVELQFPIQCTAHLANWRLPDDDRKALFDGVQVENISPHTWGWKGYWRCPEHAARAAS